LSHDYSATIKDVEEKKINPEFLKWKNDLENKVNNQRKNNMKEPQGLKIEKINSVSIAREYQNLKNK